MSESRNKTQEVKSKMVTLVLPIDSDILAFISVVIIVDTLN